jgi:hypothetical protein
MMKISRRMAVGSLAGAALATLPATGWPVVRSQRRLLLVDSSLTAADTHSALRELVFSASRTIEPDLVQQWRRVLLQEVKIHAGHVTALVRWDKSIVLAGLAREASLPVSTSRLSRSLFRIDIES